MTDIPQTTPQEPTQAVPAEPIKAPALPYTIKANLVEYRRRIGLWRVILSFALTFLFFVKFGFVVWLLSVIGLTVLIAVILWRLGRRSIIISPDGIEYVNGIGRRTKMTFSDIEGAKVFINYYEPSFGVVPRVSIGRKSGKSPISLMGLFWPAIELDKLIAVLNDKKVKVEYYEDVANYGMIAKQFPAYATYVERHPYKLATIIVIAILVAIVAIVIPITLA